MRDATTQLLQQLQTTPWFTQIGQPLDEPEIMRLGKWMDAMAASADPWWEMVGYQQAVALREAVAGASPEADARWEKLAEQFAAVVRPLVARQVKPLRAERGFPAEAEMILGHHLRHALLELELLAADEPGFFVEYAHWLLRGRMVCGVDENGRVLIY
ncbi:MAG TPA: hypothetical protein PKC45_18870 [Gemmatales bacterium]|nr:hypothetical protein [Gemmatales bacterium]